MSDIKGDVWGWLKTAPLPVVLAISLTGFMALGNWIHNVSADTERAKTAAQDAKAKSSEAKSVADRADDKLDKVTEKLDQLLEEVIRLRTIQEQADSKKKKP